LVKIQRKWIYSLSLRERVGVRDSGCTVIAGVSLLLTSSLREEGQDKKDFLCAFVISTRARGVLSFTEVCAKIPFCIVRSNEAYIAFF